MTDQRICDIEKEDTANMQEPNYRALAAALGLSVEELDGEVAGTAISYTTSDPVLQAELRRQSKIQNRSPSEIITEILIKSLEIQKDQAEPVQLKSPSNATGKPKIRKVE